MMFVLSSSHGSPGELSFVAIPPCSQFSVTCYVPLDMLLSEPENNLFQVARLSTLTVQHALSRSLLHLPAKGMVPNNVKEVR